MGRRYWLASINFSGAPGGVLRVATDAVSATDSAGLGYVFAPGLGPVIYRDEMPVPGKMGVPPSAVLEILGVDVAALMQDGHTLAFALCELALWEEGATWEQRRVVLVGECRLPEYGEPDEPVRVSVVATLAPPSQRYGVDTSEWPDVPLDYVITRTTAGQLPDPSWTVIDVNGDTSYLPIVIGYPGHTVGVDGQARQVPGFQPAQWLASYAYASYGHIGATDIGIRRKSSPATTSFSVTTTSAATDSSNRPVTIFDWGAVTPPLWGIVSPNLGNTKGGILRIEGDVSARDLFDVLRLLHFLAAVPLDDGAMRAAEPFLRAYLIDTVLEEPVALMDWVSAELLAMLPLAAVPGPLGVRYLVHRPDCTAAEAVYTIDVDRNPDVVFVGPVEIDDEVVGSVALRYAYDISINQPTATVTGVGPADAYTAGTDVVRCADLRTTAAPAWTHDSAVLYARATAALVVAQVAARLGQPRRLLKYLCPIDAAEHLTLGAIVTIKHAALSLSSQPGQVMALEWSDDGLLGVEMLCYSVPGRSAAG